MSRTKRFELLALPAAILTALGTGIAAAQQGQSAADQPRQNAGIVISAEGAAAAPSRRPARRLLREGTFLSDRQGWLRPLGAERWAYVFDPTNDGVTDPPMAVVPSLKLMEMRRIVEARPETVTFRVSGRVTVYKGRNYLLPTFFVTLAESTVPAGVGELTDIERADARRGLDDLMGRGVSPNQLPGGPANADSDDPDSILRDIDKATPNQSVPPIPAPSAPFGSNQASALDRTNPGTSANGNGSASAGTGSRLIREGTMLASRRGRLLRGPVGELVFAPDNGVQRDAGQPATSQEAGTPNTADPEAGVTGPLAPMRLLPCLNLQEMERLTQAHAVPLEFKISGQLFVYDGKNYLLPTMYLIESDRDGNITRGQ